MYQKLWYDWSADGLISCVWFAHHRCHQGSASIPVWGQGLLLFIHSEGQSHQWAHQVLSPHEKHTEVSLPEPQCRISKHKMLFCFRFTRRCISVAPSREMAGELLLGKTRSKPPSHDPCVAAKIICCVLRVCRKIWDVLCGG